MNKHLALMSISRYCELSDNFIYKIRQKCNNSENIFNKLPKYTYNTNTNKLVYCEEYLQFIGCFKDEKINEDKYPMFDIEIIDNVLSEEISNIGIEEVFKEIDIKKMLSYFVPKNDEDMMFFSMPTQNYVVIEIEYFTSKDYESGMTELYDIQYHLYGYLNDIMEIVKINEL